jgi:hypothetical protein
VPAASARPRSLGGAAPRGSQGAARLALYVRPADVEGARAVLRSTLLSEERGGAAAAREGAEIEACPACGAAISASASQCPDCGLEFVPVEVACPACGAVAEPEAATCARCGAALPAPGSA